VIREAIADVAAGLTLDPARMEGAMEAILAGEATPTQIAALAMGLRVRGESASELAAAARVLRRRSTPPPRRSTGPLLDTCGTGGDGAGSFNVSTISAIVVAACGVRVAKHGNRAQSSRAGSADVLEALGVAIDPGPERVARDLDELGIGFLFAPAFHAALRHAAPVRRELGVRTFFNLLGPLSSPAGATHQLVGVYDRARVVQLAEVLALLGVERAWVVHGLAGGLDEISPDGPTEVAVLAGGSVSTRTIEPRDFGLEPAAIESLAGGDAALNARIARDVLSGAKGGPRTAVLLGAAGALLVADVETDPRAAAERAASAIDSGAATALLDRWIAR
jgi:anthranilate phosphoribosyltransferase